ncbi:MAG: ferritin-like domain-containing protein [Actinobacteria bacterium]|nr:ferritin-like domain-containing protein [Actinomycetota bacterium]MBA3562374.1 ferritin-like domain-containing protein [Actinomycetota bacterium]
MSSQPVTKAEGVAASADTRAAFLRKAGLGSAALVAGGSLAGALPGAAKAHTTPTPPTDVDMLNYALTLEHLEATFYVQGLEVFSRGDLTGAEFLGGFGGRIRSKVYDYFELIRTHELAHVNTLQSVITSLGGTPVPACTYNFERTAFTSVEQFVSVARDLENTGVMAYDGAIAHIEAAALLTAGATIATVEARHASYLNLINGDVPFPNEFDTPVAPRVICRLVDERFIDSCPSSFDLAEFCSLLPDTVTPTP